MTIKKMLIGITLSEIGGAQRVVYDIISSLEEISYDITLVTSPGGELIKWINELNKDRTFKINIILIPYLTRNISLIKDLRVLVKLYRILKKGKYDIAHFHSSKMGILGRLSAWLAKVPKIIFTVHGWGINDYQNSFKRYIFSFIEGISGVLCHKVICVSQYDRRKGIDNKWVKEDRVTVIHNGVGDAPITKGKLFNLVKIDQKDIIIGSIARLKEPKDPIFTINVFNEVIKKGYNIKLIILGDGVLREQCRRTIDFLGLNDYVYLLGSREDAREILNDVDILTLFSKWEGLPLSIIEGMFAEKPIVASNVGGVSELVIHGENGYLLDEFDISLGVRYIERLVNNSKLRNRMGLISKEVAIKSFSKKRMIKDYEKLYKG